MVKWENHSAVYFCLLVKNIVLTQQLGTKKKKIETSQVKKKSQPLQVIIMKHVIKIKRQQQFVQKRNVLIGR